jgi:hypothetical protein
LVVCVGRARVQYNNIVEVRKSVEIDTIAQISTSNIDPSCGWRGTIKLKQTYRLGEGDERKPLVIYRSIE